MTTTEFIQKEIADFKSKLSISTEGDFERKLIQDIVKILDTNAIQNLKNRLQLGLAYKVLNNINIKHSRFEHTVGVVAKCIVACDIINSNTKDATIRLTEIDVRELLVAAALHDCGHLPISHATERAFLNARNLSKGLSHEERILPLIINRNPYFNDLQTLVLQWEGFDYNSFYRIASIISPEMGEVYELNIPGFTTPKRAVQQLLVSDIDMDRLDYVTRDADKLNYSAVKIIEDRIIEYIKGIKLIEYKSLTRPHFNKSKHGFVNVELCVEKAKIENIFYLLVGRVLLYKYVYFSKEVRSFEAILTYLVGTLIDNEIALESLKLIAMSDQEFIDSYLEKLVGYLNEDDKKHLTEKYINVLKFDKVQRFKHLLSIHDYDIGNPRLKEEFTKNIKHRHYIENLKEYLRNLSSEEVDTKSFITNLERSDILLDIFILKTGGGDLIVESYHKENINTPEYKTLKDYMNGSNMHRLCSETRLDIYCKSDSSEAKKEFIKNKINNFFKEF